MECHVSCHGHNPGGPDPQNTAIQAHWSTLLQTHTLPPHKQLQALLSARQPY